MEQLAATGQGTAVMQTGADPTLGLAKEARQHVTVEIWNVDLKPNAQAF